MKLEQVWRAQTHQRLFRNLMVAMANPGQRMDVEELMSGRPPYLGVLATLVDTTVSMSDPHKLLDVDSLTLLEAPVQAPDRALFVVADGSLAPDFEPALGSLVNPEKSSTLVLTGRSLGQGELRLDLSGPGIEGKRHLQVDGFHQQWFIRRVEWVKDFPMGVDLILCDNSRIAALPRTTCIGGI